MPLRLAKRASRDLEDMYNLGLDRWGVEQADRYLDQFWRIASFVEAFPRSARVRTEIVGEVRVRRFSSHLILYAIEENDVLVIRVAHGRSDWINDPV